MQLLFVSFYYVMLQMELLHNDFLHIIIIVGHVAQVGRVAQWLEYWIHNREIVGSI